jgi:exodeoxyribonuclease VII large subunit
LQSQGQHLKFAVKSQLNRDKQHISSMQSAWPGQVKTALAGHRERLARSQRGLLLLDPQLVLQRGYAWLADEAGATVADAALVQPGQALRATLAKGRVDLTVK